MLGFALPQELGNFLENVRVISFKKSRKAVALLMGEFQSFAGDMGEIKSRLIGKYYHRRPAISLGISRFIAFLAMQEFSVFLHQLFFAACFANQPSEILAPFLAHLFTFTGLRFDPCSLTKPIRGSLRILERGSTRISTIDVRIAFLHI